MMPQNVHVSFNPEDYENIPPRASIALLLYNTVRLMMDSFDAAEAEISL